MSLGENPGAPGHGYGALGRLRPRRQFYPAAPRRVCGPITQAAAPNTVNTLYGCTKRPVNKPSPVFYRENERYARIPSRRDRHADAHHERQWV